MLSSVNFSRTWIHRNFEKDCLDLVHCKFSILIYIFISLKREQLNWKKIGLDRFHIPDNGIYCRIKKNVQMIKLRREKTKKKPLYLALKTGDCCSSHRRSFGNNFVETNISFFFLLFFLVLHSFKSIKSIIIIFLIIIIREDITTFSIPFFQQ